MSTILLIGNTGVGKSTIGCRLVSDPNAFLTDYSSESVTSELLIKFTIIQGKSLSIIGNPGLNDSHCTDEANTEKTVNFLKSHAKQINVVALVFNFQAPRIDESLAFYIAMINDINFYPKYDSDPTELELKIRMYQKEFPGRVRQCYIYFYDDNKTIIPKIMGFADIKCFFMDCKSMSNDQQEEINRLIRFAFETPGRNTSHFVAPDHAKFKLLKRSQ